MSHRFRNSLAGLALTLALVGSLLAALSFGAHAQTVNSSTYTYPGQWVTYSAVETVTPASSATDMFTITGSASKRARVLDVDCSGVSTAIGQSFIQVVKRSTANADGTAVTGTAVPLNSTSAAAASTVRSYTANPTLGTAVGNVAAGYLVTVNATTPTISNTGITFDFSNQNVMLNSASQVLAINANATSLPSGASLQCRVIWAES